MKKIFDFGTNDEILVSSEITNAFTSVSEAKEKLENKTI